MTKGILIILLILPQLAVAQYYDTDGHLIVSWLPPDSGNPLDHYTWKYTINGVEDSTTGNSSAGIEVDSSIVLGNRGDWAIFKLRAVSIMGDTSAEVISDTAYFSQIDAIGPDSESSSSLPNMIINIFPNPAGQNGALIRWHIASLDYYSVAIYNILGALLTTVESGEMSRGVYSAPLKKELASGIYFAIIKSPREYRVTKFTIVH